MNVPQRGPRGAVHDALGGICFRRAHRLVVSSTSWSSHPAGIASPSAGSHADRVPAWERVLGSSPYQRDGSRSASGSLGCKIAIAWRGCGKSRGAAGHSKIWVPSRGGNREPDPFHFKGLQRPVGEFPGVERPAGNPCVSASRLDPTISRLKILSCLTDLPLGRGPDRCRSGPDTVYQSDRVKYRRVPVRCWFTPDVLPAGWRKKTVMLDSSVRARRRDPDCAMSCN